MVGVDGVIPLPHIYGARIKGVEVFCPLDPPPPYEEVAGGGASAQVGGICWDTSCLLSWHSGKARLSRSSSDPLLTEDPSKGALLCPHTYFSQGPQLMCLCADWSNEPLAVPHTVDSSTQTSQPILPTKVTLRRGCGARAPTRPRPSSMVDYQSYRHTQLLVQRILEQPAQGLAPELQELVDSIRTVLQSDQEHMEEAVRCAGFMDQPVPSTSQTFPRPPSRRTALLHLQSCGDLSSVACPSLDSLKRGAKRRGASRPERHSLATVSRETAL
uniref:Protein FAM189A2 n=1 Tax=Periophthalmus magnuspinnatus TaxID=409849 RepID=A0A3B4AX63_9GOBI